VASKIDYIRLKSPIVVDIVFYKIEVLAVLTDISAVRRTLLNPSRVPNLLRGRAGKWQRGCATGGITAHASPNSLYLMQSAIKYPIGNSTEPSCQLFMGMSANSHVFNVLVFKCFRR
jgi:hypothetical protein